MKQHVRPKRLHISATLHGVITGYTVIFIANRHENLLASLFFEMSVHLYTAKIEGNGVKTAEA